ncbi:MAG: peptide deformylase [Prevotellaceae bacterium]|nr:peptide deformylase [Candidatus Colivivens caballi]
MILPMYIFGQQVLRKQAEDIPTDYPNLKELIDNMFETMKRAEGVGLAAPQIGLAIRLFVVDLDVISDDMPQYKGFLHAYINPQIVEVSDETNVSEEGCLSVPGIHENVRRPVRVHATYLDENLVEHDEWIDDFAARVFQHEYDHLEGKMFIDHISPLRKQLIKKKLIAMQKGQISCDYKIKQNR